MIPFYTTLPLFLSVFTIIKSSYIAPNSLISDSISNSNLKYYTIKTDKLNGVSKDLFLTSNLEQGYASNITPIMIVSTKPLPNTDKQSQWICGAVGKEGCLIPSDFIRRAERWDIGIFCDNCKYSFSGNFAQAESVKVDASKINQNNIRSLVNVPSLRLLQQIDSNATGNTENIPQNTNGDIVKDEAYRWNDLRATGIAGLSVGIIFIITVVIGCVIWMQIFVNTKFVLQPLKLGKIDG